MGLAVEWSHGVQGHKIQKPNVAGYAQICCGALQAIPQRVDPNAVQSDIHIGLEHQPHCLQQCCLVLHKIEARHLQQPPGRTWRALNGRIESGHVYTQGQP